jgi:hypothetical protein
MSIAINLRHNDSPASASGVWADHLMRAAPGGRRDIDGVNMRAEEDLHDQVLVEPAALLCEMPQVSGVVLKVFDIEPH